MCIQAAEIEKSINVTQAATKATRQLEVVSVQLKEREGEVFILKKRLEEAEKSFETATTKPPISLQVRMNGRTALWRKNDEVDVCHRQSP